MVEVGYTTQCRYLWPYQPRPTALGMINAIDTSPRCITFTYNLIIIRL